MNRRARAADTTTVFGNRLLVAREPLQVPNELSRSVRPITSYCDATGNNEQFGIVGNYEKANGPFDYRDIANYENGRPKTFSRHRVDVSSEGASFTEAELHLEGVLGTRPTRTATEAAPKHKFERSFEFFNFFDRYCTDSSSGTSHKGTDNTPKTYIVGDRAGSTSPTPIWLERLRKPSQNFYCNKIIKNHGFYPPKETR